MYARIETIEEENLDWKKHLAPHSEKLEGETQENKHLIHPATEHNKIIFKKKVKVNYVYIKREITNLLAQYSEISLLLSLLILPYVIGFFVIAFILLTGGVPIDSFFSLKETIFHFELWSIGSYIFVTVGVIWLVILLFQQRR